MYLARQSVNSLAATSDQPQPQDSASMSIPEASSSDVNHSTDVALTGNFVLPCMLSVCINIV